MDKERKEPRPEAKPVFKLDPNSDFYRVCPACGREFIARHRSMKFCNNHCHDEYNNRIKRERKEVTF